MFKRNPETDWDLDRLSDEELSELPLEILQRVRNKRWAHGLDELRERAEAEIRRRDPRLGWKCKQCGGEKFEEQDLRISGGFVASFLGWETNKFHSIICSYCGKTEMYKVLMSTSEKGIGFFGS